MFHDDSDVVHVHLSLRPSHSSQSPGPAELQEVQSGPHEVQLCPSLVYGGSLDILDFGWTLLSSQKIKDFQRLLRIKIRRLGLQNFQNAFDANNDKT